MPSAKKQFISTERAHIVDVMEKLAHALPQSVLADKAAPLIVATQGAPNIGKSLLPFVFRETLFAEPPELSGLQEMDEMWRGTGKDGKPLEIGFVNLVYPFFDFSVFLQENYPRPEKDGYKPEKQEILETFLQQRQEGGITFVSHANLAPNIIPGISIEMIYDGIMHNVPEDKRLADAFLAAVCGNVSSPWLRMIKLEVTDDRLLADPAFMKAFNSIRPVYDSRPAEKIYVKKEQSGLQMAVEA